MISSSQSSCGGLSTAALGFDVSRTEYCEAEHVFWSYDEDREQLALKWTRLVVQCDAKLVVTSVLDAGTITLSWRDDAEWLADCLCVFDITATLGGVPAETFTFVAGGATIGTADLSSEDSGLFAIGGTPLGAETYPQCE